MKKILIMTILILTLCACKSKEENIYTDFEHYDLKGKDINYYNYINDEGTSYFYALADITPDSYESTLTGLFYKVSENDYILLDTLELSSKDAYSNSYLYRFYNNKLYGVGNGNTPTIFVYDLNGPESKMRELKFKVDAQEISPTSIKNVADKYITLHGLIFLDEHNVSKTFKCSLTNYQCKIQDN